MTILRWAGFTTFLLFVLPAQAMRIGDLQAQSQLNQPLLATLPVQSLSAAERNSLVVKVAGADAYSRLGLERSTAVEGLRFDILTGETGGVDIRVRGRRPVVDPYVVLVLDFRTSSGRMLREFTMLLDPENAAPPVDLPPALQESEQPAFTDDTEALEAEAPTEATSPAAPVVDQDWNPRSAATDRSTEDGNRPIISEKDYLYAAKASENTGGFNYGPIRPGESLSSIANALLPQTGGHVSQLMWALYAENPDAFDGSINALRAGARLVVPGASEIQQTSIADARRNIRDAASGAGAPSRQADAVEPTYEVIEPTPVEGLRAEIDRAEARAAEVDENEVAEVPAAPEELPSDASSLTEEVAEAGADSGDGFTTEDAAEETVPRVDTEVTTVSASKASDSDVMALLSRFWLPLLALVVLLLIVVLIARRRKSTHQNAVENDTSADLPAHPTPDLISMARGEPIPDPLEAKPRQSKPPEKEEEELVLLDDAPLGAAVETTHRDGDAEQEPAISDAKEADSDDTIESVPVKASVQDENDSLQESAELADDQSEAETETETEVEVDDSETYTIDEPEATEDKDPVAEAEYQLAYGLYDEAAQTLKSVLEAEPGRLDAQEKLAEVYFAAGRAGDFEKLAMTMRAESADSTEYHNVEALARQLIPESRLFSESQEGVVEGSERELEDENDSAVQADTFEAVETLELADNDNVVEFELPEVDPGEEGADDTGNMAQSADTQDHSGNLIDFDLGSVDDSTDETVPSFEIDDLSADDDPQSSADMDLETFTLADEPDADIEATSTDADALLELEESEAEGGAFVLDDSDDDGIPLDAFNEALGEDGDMAAKLDLARGYADMGETAVAKSLLDEVISRGSESEQKEAQNMLESLS